MIVTLEIPSDTREKIAADAVFAGRSRQAALLAMEEALRAGELGVREFLVSGESGLRARGAGTGLAHAVTGWMLDPSLPLGAIGVPSQMPESKFARIQEEGGTIVPKVAGALAVPVFPAARDVASPRDVDGLTLIKRAGKPSLLVKMLGARGFRKAQWQIWYVLVQRVTLPATHWLTRGVEKSVEAMGTAFSAKFFEVVRAK